MESANPLIFDAEHAALIAIFRLLAERGRKLRELDKTTNNSSGPCQKNSVSEANDPPYDLESER